nr:DNA-binding transcriptional regulator DhaR [Klebsiella pneumoniae]
MVQRGKGYDCSDSGYREGGLFRHCPVMAPLQQVYAARNRQTPHQAQGLTFDSICRRKTALLTIGRRRWKTPGVYGRPPCALFILDESACILSRCGEPQTLAQLAAPISRRQLLCGEHYRHLRAVAGRDAGPADQHRRRSAF